MALFLITGASGSGKTSIARRLQEQNVWGECISHTTRGMREGEIDGETYYFVNEDQYMELDAKRAFAEKVVYDKNYYGITKDEINRAINEYKDVFIIADYNGFKQIKEQYPNVISIFLYMTKEDCMANMLLRGDSLERAEQRISTYDDEIKNRIHYDYVVKNVRDKQEHTAGMIYNIVRQYR